MWQGVGIDTAMLVRRLLILFFAIAASALRGETPALLEAAIAKLVADDGRWAYTQQVRTFDDGKVDDDRVERYDPSKPEGDQWELLKVDGRLPTQSEREKWEKRKRRETKRKEGAEQRQSLATYLDFEHATVRTETPELVSYEVPLKSLGNKRFPPEKFVVTTTVSKTREAFERIELNLREAFRVKGVLGLAKIDSAGASIRFEVVDPAHAPAVTAIDANGTGRIIFIKVGGQAELRRSAYQRVKPYKDRFAVKVGDVKAIDF